MCVNLAVLLVAHIHTYVAKKHNLLNTVFVAKYFTHSRPFKIFFPRYYSVHRTEVQIHRDFLYVEQYVRIIGYISLKDNKI